MIEMEFYLHYLDGHLLCAAIGGIAGLVGDQGITEGGEAGG